MGTATPHPECPRGPLQGTAISSLRAHQSSSQRGRECGHWGQLRHRDSEAPQGDKNGFLAWYPFRGPPLPAPFSVSFSSQTWGGGTGLSQQCVLSQNMLGLEGVSGVLRSPLHTSLRPCLAPLSHPKSCPHPSMSSQSLPASCPLPSPRSVRGSPSCRRPPGPTARHRHEPPLPRWALRDAAGLLGARPALGTGATGEATQRTAPAAMSTQGCFPCRLPEEQGKVSPRLPGVSRGP